MMFGDYETLGNNTGLSAAAEAMMASDGLLRSQFYALFQSKRTPGWKRLLVFVLRQAMDDYDAPLLNGYKPNPERIRKEVRAWIESNNRSSLCCFVPLCEALDLEVTSVRRALRWQMDEVDAGRSIARLWNFIAPVRINGVCHSQLSEVAA